MIDGRSLAQCAELQRAVEHAIVLHLDVESTVSMTPHGSTAGRARRRPGALTSRRTALLFGSRFLLTACASLIVVFNLDDAVSDRR